MSDNYDFLDDIKNNLDAERAKAEDVTPERAAHLKGKYPADGSATPAAYKNIKPEEFFDGS